MKGFVGFVAIILAIGSVSSLGSGPYLPSGWRPTGPAFFLPGEVQKPVLVAEPIKETVIFETEASGSDALREYGPPNQISDNLISQGLPDLVTDQTFLVADSRGSVSAVEVKTAESIEQTSELNQEQTTDTIAIEKAIAFESMTDIKLQADVTTALYTEEAKSETEVKFDVAEVKSEVAEIDSKIDLKSKEEGAVADVADLKSEVTKEKPEEVEATSEVVALGVVESEVAKSEDGVQKTEEITEPSVENLEKAVIQEVEVAVKNIAEVLVNLENENKSKQVEDEAIAEIKTDDGSTEAPEGFLEYGPPGFREYGPPKGDELFNFAAIQEPSNEVRRRRFSPKFRATTNKRIH